ncbi:MAG: hypothetical protein NXI31_14090 [bacterium]|nr:hypothetical protein [bacterium]
MDVLRVKKIVVVCFVEAVRLALDHLGSYRMANAGQEASDVPKAYGDLRRLRDYLQRGSSGSHDLVELDLADADRALLVASCRRYVDAIDLKLEGPEVRDAKERQFLAKKQKLIADWAIEIAAKPLVELPIPKLRDIPGDGARGLKTRLQQKLFNVQEQTLIRQGQLDTMGAVTGTGPGVAGGPSGRAPGVSQGTVPVIDLTSPLPDEDPLVGFGGPGSPGPGAGVAGPASAAGGGAAGLLDPATIQDPRLRSMITMNLRSLEFAQKTGDYRIVTLLLAAVLETVVLDYALRYSAELGLHGAAESWDAQHLLFQILGDGVTANERMLGQSLFSARQLLDPAHQMNAPMVVTNASADHHRGFVEAMLHQLGYVGRARR